MYNHNIPNENELPTSKQLIKSTVIALLTAVILLVTVILPAEYGIDPSGVGRILGLTKMGEIKTQLAAEAEQEIQQPTPAEIQPTKMAVENNSEANSKADEVTPTETRSIQLKPGEAAELKLGMKKDAIVIYEWSVNTGHVNYDTHGDGAGINYFGYGKGKKTKQDKGELKAAFDGKHGWFWRNRSEQAVTVTLRVSGEYSDIQRVL